MKDTQSESEYVSFIQAAYRLGLTRQRVDQFLRAGRIPYQIRDGRRRIKRSDLEKFAAVERQTGRPPKKIF